jgi:hypothetical protein
MTRFNGNNIFKSAIHILAWLVLFVFPYLQFPEQSDDFGRILKSVWIPLLEYAIIFYINYFFFINKLLFRKKLILYFIINILIIIFFFWFNIQFREIPVAHDMHGMMPPGDMPGKPPGGFPSPERFFVQPYKFFIFRDLFSFFIPVIFSIAVKATESWIKSDAEKKEIENRNLESELQILRYQLQPHFFFNSLNNIYSLVDVSPEKAQEAIHSLSSLMRYLLYDTGREKVDLRDEIVFLRKYIQLMQLRLTEKTKTTVSFPDDSATGYFISPLLFIPLVENAFKHCISATHPSGISFRMYIEGKNLVFLSENTNFPKNNSDISGSGIGLKNLKKRLDMLYQGKYELVYGVSENIFRASLTMEINRESVTIHKEDNI